MMPTLFNKIALVGMLCSAIGATSAAAQAASAAGVPIQRADRVVFIGNTFAERMQLFPHFEVLTSALFPADSLTFRNLGWSGDEVALRPRPLNFGDLHTHLAEQRADLIFAAFGMNESFGGEAGLPTFRADLETLLRELTAHRYNGRSAPRVVLLSPIAHERVASVPLDPTERNRLLALYTGAMREVAADVGVHFVDLHTPTLALMAASGADPLTINGIHLNDRGYAAISRLMLQALGWMQRDPLAAPLAPARQRTVEQLTARVQEKNELFFLRWRAVNGEYIYGRRREPFGVVDFPPEMRALEEMIGGLERDIWTLAGSLR